MATLFKNSHKNIHAQEDLNLNIKLFAKINIFVNCFSREKCAHIRQMLQACFHVAQEISG